MARNLPPLNALRAFEAAGRHLSFTRASLELNVTQGAISRQVKNLEVHLGVRLFNRLTRRLELTESGHTLYLQVRESLDMLERAVARVRERHGSGVLTVDALTTLAMRWLIGRLPSFTEKHPMVEVRMVTSIKPVDFRRDDIDVAIRVGSLQAEAQDSSKPRIDLVMTDDWSGIHADFLVKDLLVPVCNPATANGPLPLRKPEDLRHHTLLHTATRPRAWHDWLAAVEITDFVPNDEPAYGHFFMALQEAAKGRGVALVPHILVIDDLALGNLVVPFRKPIASHGGYYLLCRDHQWNDPKVALFRDWLKSELASCCSQEDMETEIDPLPRRSA